MASRVTYAFSLVHFGVSAISVGVVGAAEVGTLDILQIRRRSTGSANGVWAGAWTV